MNERINFQSAGAVPMKKWHDNKLNDALRAARESGDSEVYARYEAEARRRGWAGYVSTNQFGGG